MKKKKLVGILTIILVVLIVIAVVLGIKNGKAGSSGESSTNVEGNVVEGIPVETKYGDFVVSDQWYDYFEYEIDEEDEYTVKFCAKYEDVEVVLFSLVFGETEEGTFIGEIGHNDGNVNVYINLTELEFPEEIPAEKKNAFYAMQEEVNSILEQLNQMDNFTQAK